MLCGAGSAERCDGVRKPELREGHHVHVAFDDKHEAVLAQRSAGFEQAVELAALAEHRRLGRVEVLGLAFVEHAATEADHLALHRADRKHDPIAKAVVALALGVVVALAALRNDEPAFFEQRVVVAREHAGQSTPSVARVAEAEARGDLAAQSTAFQIVDGA